MLISEAWKWGGPGNTTTDVCTYSSMLHGVRSRMGHLLQEDWSAPQSAGSVTLPASSSQLTRVRLT